MGVIVGKARADFQSLLAAAKSTKTHEGNPGSHSRRVLAFFVANRRLWKSSERILRKKGLDKEDKIDYIIHVVKEILRGGGL